jgi:hypothetical protein
MFGKIIKALTGSSNAEAKKKPVEVIDYNGFGIEPEPIEEDGKYRIAGYIRAEVEGELKRIRFIRADILTNPQSAIDQSVSKARQIIDEQGQKLLTKNQL